MREREHYGGKGGNKGEGEWGLMVRMKKRVSKGEK